MIVRLAIAAWTLGAAACVGADARARETDLGHSYNTKAWYAAQPSTETRWQGLTYNGADQRTVIAHDAGAIAAGMRSDAVVSFDHDRFQVRILLNVFPRQGGGAQTILAVGGGEHAWGIGYSSTGNLFLALRNGDQGLHALGCPFPDDGQMRDVLLYLDKNGASITIDGVAQGVVYAWQGGEPELDLDAAHEAVIGSRAPGGLCVFFRVMADATNTPAFEAVMGPAPDYTSGNQDRWLHGAVSSLTILRGDAWGPQNRWSLNDGAGVPTGVPDMAENTASWGGAPPDSFLLHWTLAPINYNLGSTGGNSPGASPVVGQGPLGLSSWSDDGAYGLPAMFVGPFGPAVRTQHSSAPRHSELYMATPLYNTPAYYIAWTGHIDADAFTLPGFLDGSVRLNRLSQGDNPTGFPLTLVLGPGSNGQPELSWTGVDVNNVSIPNILPFDQPFRAIIRYIPSRNNEIDSGVIELSFDAGQTWPLSTTHNRVDNYHYRHGMRSVTLPSGRHWIRDLAYGSDLDEVWNAVTPVGADLNGDGVVNGSDLGLMLLAWGPCPAPCTADFNNDGVVNGSDLGVLLLAWGSAG